MYAREPIALAQLDVSIFQSVVALLPSSFQNQYECEFRLRYDEAASHSVANRRAGGAIFTRGKQEGRIS